jgi:di- and tripeptidase
LRDAVGGQNLEIDKQDVRQFAHYGYVNCMLLGRDILPESPADEVLVSGGGDGHIKFWKIDSKRNGAISEIYTLEDGTEDGGSILSLARDGTFLYSGRLGGEINVWDLETRQLVRSLKAQTGDVLTLSLGGGLLFVGGVEGVVQVSKRAVWPCIATDPASSEIQSTLRNSLHLQGTRRFDTRICLRSPQRQTHIRLRWK